MSNVISNSYDVTMKSYDVMRNRTLCLPPVKVSGRVSQVRCASKATIHPRLSRRVLVGRGRVSETVAPFARIPTGVPSHSAAAGVVAVSTNCPPVWPFAQSTATGVQ